MLSSNHTQTYKKTLTDITQESYIRFDQVSYTEDMYGNPRGIAYVCIIGLNSEQTQGLSDITYHCYIKTADKDIEILNTEGRMFQHNATFYGEEYGVFSSYKSLDPDAFTFLTPSGNLTVNTPIEAYIIARGY